MPTPILPSLRLSKGVPRTTDILIIGFVTVAWSASPTLWTRSMRRGSGCTSSRWPLLWAGSPPQMPWRPSRPPETVLGSSSLGLAARTRPQKFFAGLQGSASPSRHHGR